MIDPGEEQPDVTPAQREEWERQVERVDHEMREYTKPFVTPISRVLKDETGEYGRLEGTGSYIQLSGRRIPSDERACRSGPCGQFAGASVFQLR